MGFEKVLFKIMEANNELNLKKCEILYAKDISIKIKLVSDSFHNLQDSERFNLVDKNIEKKFPDILSTYSVSYELKTIKEDLFDI